jgi:hypothetical protein
VSEAPDQERRSGRQEKIGVANLREEFERRYGPLWSGASSLSIGGVTHELEDVLHRMGFGFDGLRIIDAPPVAADRYAIRFFDSEERRIVCLEFGADFNLLEEHRVHIAEWMGDAYFETEWQVNCPMDF